MHSFFLEIIVMLLTCIFKRIQQECEFEMSSLQYTITHTSSVYKHKYIHSPLNNIVFIDVISRRVLHET